MGPIIETPINDRYFEALICRAIENQYYIEVISLIHNTIEIYLQYSIKIYFLKLEESKISDKDIQKNWGKRNELLKEGSICSVNSLRAINYLLSIIDDELNDDIKTFNSKRNVVIHELLKNTKRSKEVETYNEIKKIARLGRKIQLKLSPLLHTDEEIEQILKIFDNSEKTEKIVENSGINFLSS